jgi:polysaccharide biosynthesis/export protein
MMTSRSSKICGRHLCLVLNTLIVFLCYQEIAASQEPIESVAQGISVLGEVNKPGVYPAVSSHKLFDMISAAGGTTPKAGPDILITHRNEPNNVRKITWSNEPDKQRDANVDVFPGDTILVTKGPMVYVVGDVKLPGGFIIDKSDGLTVLQALAMAQGTNPTASLAHAKIIRKISDGPEQTPINLKQILMGRAEDLKLNAGDILLVPTATSRMEPGNNVCSKPCLYDSPLYGLPR